MERTGSMVFWRPHVALTRDRVGPTLSFANICLILLCVNKALVGYSKRGRSIPYFTKLSHVDLPPLLRYQVQLEEKT